MAIEVYSRRSRKIIFNSNSRLLIHPASNLKIITTAFALDSLGVGYKFRTIFGYHGSHTNGTVDGNIVAIGGGDPILSDSDLSVAAAAIRRDSITYVTGNIAIDVSKFDSLEWGEGWMWDDEPEPFAMFITPASVDHNVISALLSRDSLTGNISIALQPRSDFVDVICTATRDTIDSVTATRRTIKGKNTIIVGGRYSPRFRPTKYEFSVRHPTEFFGTLFKDALTRAGVTIAGSMSVTRDNPQVTGVKPLFSIEHSMDTVITYINKESDNLGAECLIRLIAADRFGETGSAENGIKQETDFLSDCGIDSSQHYIVDGSGVSHYNLITPAAIVKVLRLMLNPPDSVRDIFVRSLPIGGVDGTLSDRMPFDSSSHRILAKTGSINGVSTLSGYAIIPRDTLVFSMMMESYIGASKAVRDLQDQLCNILFYYNGSSRSFVRALRKHRLGTYETLPIHKRMAPSQATSKAPHL